MSRAVPFTSLNPIPMPVGKCFFNLFGFSYRIPVFGDLAITKTVKVDDCGAAWILGGGNSAMDENKVPIRDNVPKARIAPASHQRCHVRREHVDQALPARGDGRAMLDEIR